MIAVYIIFAVLAVLVIVLLARTAAFKPKPEIEAEGDKVDFDGDAAVAALQTLVKFKTVSHEDPSLEDDGEFEALIAALPELFPNVHKACTLTRLPGRALLYRWQGKSADCPAVMMSHYDVVPAEEESWEKPPFEGIIENGLLWGRGTLDTKGTFTAALFAADTLIAQGFVPERDVYFAFSGGEEVNGEGAGNIVELFREKGLEPSIVLDEGGAVVENVFPGVKRPCGLIGIAEKGMINLRFTVASNGGHASAPKPHTPIGLLSLACAKVEAKPFKMHITKPVAEMFDTLGRHSSFLYRMIFANLWLFGGVLNMLGKSSGGDMNALLRTTVAFTQADGSPAPNVIPPHASMVANMRLNPADSVASAKEYIKKTVGDDSVELSIDHCEEPSNVSRTDGEGWDKLTKAVASTWPGCIVSPYLMMQCSDSRNWSRVSDKVYRFSAMDLTSEERATIHGHNERVRLETVYKTVEFYIRLLRQL